MHLDESFSIENCIRRALSIRVVMTHILSPCATQGCNWSNPVTERKPRDGRGARALRPQLGRLVAKQLGRLVAKPVTRTTRPALPAASIVRGTRRQGRRAVHHGGGSLYSPARRASWRMPHTAAARVQPQRRRPQMVPLTPRLEQH